jgi:hypothetical protein
MQRRGLWNLRRLPSQNKDPFLQTGSPGGNIRQEKIANSMPIAKSMKRNE